MAGEVEDDIPESGAIFTFGKSKFADNVPSKFWLKNDVPLKIACGDEHTAFITENGKLFVFGSNNWGQLGLGSKVTVSKPTCVKALKSERVHLVACGRNHTLVCTVEGKLFASGGNSEGQLGVGDCDERTTFHRINFASHGSIRMLAAGSNTSAALTESGKLYMWGDNSEGQIGLGKQSHASTPQEVSVGRLISSVSCGYYHSALITDDGGLYTFGEQDCGKLGLSTDQLTGHRVPQRVKAITDPVRQVCCGGGHTVALTDEDVYTFGLGQYGQLGHGTFIFESRLPRHVQHFKKGRVCDLSCGENHTAVITDSGLLYTFGDGRHGKLALGEENFTNQFKPTLCPRFLKFNVQAVSCGGCHMVVLARPRQDSEMELSLEEGDSTEDFLERPYVELLGHTTDSSSLNRSLSARVRRRERDKSPEQFGSIFRSLPMSVTTTGFLPPLSTNQTLLQPASVNERPRPPAEEKRKVQSGTRRQDETASITESITDTESVAGLGDTTDFLNMTHVMEMDASDKTLTLSPVQKRQFKTGKDAKLQKDQHRNEKKSPCTASVVTNKPQRLKRTKESSPGLKTVHQKQDKENRQILGRTQHSEVKTKGEKVLNEHSGSKKELQPVKVKSRLSSESSVTDSPNLSHQKFKIKVKKVTSEDSIMGTSFTESTSKKVSQTPQKLFKKTAGKDDKNISKDVSKKSEKRKKSKNEKNDLNEVETSQSESTAGLGLLAGAATLAAGATLVHTILSRSETPTQSESPKRTAMSSQSEGDALLSRKSAVSINVIPESPDVKKNSGKKQRTRESEEDQRTSADVSEVEEEESESMIKKSDKDEEESESTVKKSDKDEESEEEEESESTVKKSDKDEESEEEEESESTVKKSDKDEESEEEEERESTVKKSDKDEESEEEEESESTVKKSDKDEESEEEEESSNNNSAEQESEEVSESTTGKSVEEESEEEEEEEEEEEGSDSTSNRSGEGESEEESEEESSEESESEEKDGSSDIEEGEEEAETGSDVEEEEEEEGREEEEGESSEEDEESQEEEEESEEESEEQSAEEETTSGEEEEESDDDDDDDDEEEEEEEEEESSEEEQRKKRSRRSGVGGQAVDEAEEFWDDVLLQYLTQINQKHT